MNTTSRLGLGKPTLPEVYSLSVKNDNADRLDDVVAYPHSVLRYGAVGDGITDDTAAIQAAIVAANDYVTAGSVFFPAGKYLISAPLVIDRRVHVIGEGMGSQVYQSADDHVFDIAPYTSAACHSMSMQRLHLGSAATTPGKACINISGVSGGKFEEIYLDGGYYGVAITNSHNNIFTAFVTNQDHPQFFGSSAPTQVWFYGYGAVSNANMFLYNSLNLGIYGHYWLSGEPLSVIGGVVQGGPGMLGSYISNVTGLLIQNVHFESASAKLHLSSCDAFNVHNCYISGGFQLDDCDSGNLFGVNSSGGGLIRADCAFVNILGYFGAGITNKSATTQIVAGRHYSAGDGLPNTGIQFTQDNQIDGSGELWYGTTWPVGAGRWRGTETFTKETSIVHDGSAAIRITQSGTNGSGIYFNLDLDRLGRKYLISYRTDDYKWTASLADVGAYYLELTAGGDPGLPFEPLAVFLNDVYATEGTGGALANDQWSYGDYDSLGYDTLYVQIAAGDPDGQALGYVKAVYTYQYVTVSGWVYRGQGSANPYLGIFWNSGISNTSKAVPSQQWTRVSQTFRVEYDKTLMRVLFASSYYSQGTTGDWCVWDDLEVVEGHMASGGYSEARGVSGDFRVDGRFVENRIDDFTDGDTTPGVYAGNAFRTANSTPKTITSFDNGILNQRITIYIDDANTTIDMSSGNIRGNNGVNWSPALGDHMECAFDGTNWRCACFSD